MGIFKNDDQKSSQFGFDEKSMAGKAVKAVRWIYAITGVVALIAGIALLFAPAKSLVFLTTVLGIYFVITAAIRLFTAIFEPLLPTGWRVTSIIVCAAMPVSTSVMGAAGLPGTARSARIAM